MTYDSLIKSGRIRPYQATNQEIHKILALAKRDIGAAIRNLAEDPEWAYNIAYNAILQACRALMLAEGYRARGIDHHAIVFEFAREALGSEHITTFLRIDLIRRTRNKVVYDIPGLVSPSMAKEVIQLAESLLEIIETRLTGQSRLA